MLLFSTRTTTIARFYSVFGVSLLIAGASCVAGAMVGFVFGIPKTLQASEGSGYGANTNLEQISDWLTKIMVGVGLTQIAKLPDALKEYAAFVAPGLGGIPASEPYSVAVLLFYIVCGFLVGYLWTRIYLPREFRGADLSALDTKVDDALNKIGELEKQAAIDARALSIAQNQLNPGPGVPPIPQDDINKAIAAASRNVRAQIFYLAQDVRKRTWANTASKESMERTIPLFRALIADDRDEEFHANHGQLGFALKDQRTPDYAAAEAELSRAISIRDRLEQEGWQIYEYNRAFCRIMLNEKFQMDTASDAQAQDQIVRDLHRAMEAPGVNEIIKRDPMVQKWLGLNGVTL
jgi:hypothetical protein